MPGLFIYTYISEFVVELFQVCYPSVSHSGITFFWNYGFSLCNKISGIAAIFRFS
jgi:hypothetical protein